MDKSILVVGGVSYNTSILVNKLPAPRAPTIFPKEFMETPGGTGFGKALCLKRLGFNVTLHGIIGNDTFGEEVRLSLDKEKIPFFYITDPRGTQRHVNIVDDQGERFAFFNHVSELPSGTEIDLQTVNSLISQHELVILNINEYCKHLIPFIKKTGKQIWCDIHDYDGKNEYYADFINSADFLLMSAAVLPDYKAAMKEVVQHGVKSVICTHGREGASALNSTGDWIEIPVIKKYEGVNTTGAGDCFMAGLVYGHVEGYPLKKSLEIATLVSGICIASVNTDYSDLCPEKVQEQYQLSY